jgi:integrase
LSQTTVQHHFKRICRSIGLERHFHDTRHTFATEGIRIGIPIKTISDALGHYSTAFTMDVYGHTTEQMHQEAAERFQASISERLSSQSF